MYAIDNIYDNDDTNIYDTCALTSGDSCHKRESRKSATNCQYQMYRFESNLITGTLPFIKLIHNYIQQFTFLSEG